VLDLENPETLVYLLTPGGENYLLGAAYKAPYGEGPDVAGGLAEWHSHFQVCFTADGQPTPRESFSQCPEGATPREGAVEMMHVWTFDNPDGPFEGHLSAAAFVAAFEQTTGGDGEEILDAYPQLRERLEREIEDAEGEGDGHSHEGDESLGHELHGTSDPEAEEELYARSLRDAERFTDFALAEAEGYERVTPFRNGDWGPAHFRNVAYTRDGVPLDSARPENLVYIRTGEGEMILAGVMYVAHVDQLDRQWGLEWHTHETGCVGASGAARINADGTCPAGMIRVPKEAAMLHVWFFNHPDGLFAHSLTADAVEVALAELAS
jgi:hypothetical protein